jgi:hypothetical protein
MRPISLSRSLESFLARALPPMRANSVTVRSFFMPHNIPRDRHASRSRPHCRPPLFLPGEFSDAFVRAAGTSRRPSDIFSASPEGSRHGNQIADHKDEEGRASSLEHGGSPTSSRTCRPETSYISEGQTTLGANKAIAAQNQRGPRKGMSVILINSSSVRRLHAAGDGRHSNCIHSLWRDRTGRDRKSETGTVVDRSAAEAISQSWNTQGHRGRATLCLRIGGNIAHPTPKRRVIAS